MSALPEHSRTVLMGVVNVTPDSFSDGGQWFEEEVAIAHGRHLISQGADIVDVGGESTRPGALRVSRGEELARIVPVVRALAQAGAVVSVDTMRAEVAEAALDAGAALVNDVSGGLADPNMASFIAERGCPYVAMHWRSHAAAAEQHETYEDVVAEVAAELSQRVEALLGAGVRESQLILDPGLGFSKGSAANWELLKHLDRLQALGFPLLVGASRKRFLGDMLSEADREALPQFRDRATAAVTALLSLQGVWGVRVHDVSASLDAVLVVEKVRRAP